MAKQLKKQKCGGKGGVRMDKPESSDMTTQELKTKQYVVLTVAHWLDLRNADIIIHN